MTKLIYPNFPTELIKSQIDLDRYIRFIDSRPIRKQKVGITEYHHKVPRIYGGTTLEENMVHLTYREHWIAHLMLYNAFGGKMTNAFYMMNNFNKYSSKLSSKQYSVLKEKRSKELSKTHKNKMNITDGIKNKKIPKDDLIPNGWHRGVTRKEGVGNIPGTTKRISNGTDCRVVPVDYEIPKGWYRGTAQKNTKLSKETKEKARKSREANGTVMNKPYSEERKAKAMKTRLKNRTIK